LSGAEDIVSYEFYKILHVVSVLFAFTAIGGLAALGRSRGNHFRRLIGIVHGLALVVLFVAGFGLLARLGHFGDIPAWAWLKMVVWLLLAAAAFPLRRWPAAAGALLLVLPMLGALAVWLAVSKPF
jgi:hypothetical protein